MQIEKSKKVVTDLIDVCDSTVKMFYLAGAKGLVADKMACIDFTYKMIFETTKVFNLMNKDVPFLNSITATITTLTPDVLSVERTFGVMFNALQQYRLHLKAWLDSLDPA